MHLGEIVSVACANGALLYPHPACDPGSMDICAAWRYFIVTYDKTMRRTDSTCSRNWTLLPQFKLWSR